MAFNFYSVFLNNHQQRNIERKHATTLIVARVEDLWLLILEDLKYSELQRSISLYTSLIFIYKTDQERKPTAQKKIGKVSRKIFSEPNGREEKQKKSTRPKGESGRQH